MRPRLAGELWRHLLVGAWTYALTLALMYLLANVMVMDELAAYALVQVIMFALNFRLTRNWVFRHGAVDVTAQFTRFVLAGIAFRALNWAVYTAAWGWLGMPRELAVIVATAALYPPKFLTHKLLVFRKHPGH